MTTTTPVAAQLAVALDPAAAGMDRLRAAGYVKLYLDALLRGLVEAADADGTPWPLIAGAAGVSVAEARVLYGPDHTRGHQPPAAGP